MPYDFSNLSPTQFETLARDLVGRETGLRFEAFSVGRDDGIDGRHARGNETTILQAKHYKDFKSLSTTMKKERLSIDRLSPQRYILVTSAPLTPGNKGVLSQTIGPCLQTTGDIFGRDDLNALLSRNPDIERAHSALWAQTTAVLEELLKDAFRTVVDQKAKLLPDISNIDLEHDASDVADIVGSLAFSRRLPEPLLQLFLSGGGAAGDVDAHLSAGNAESAKDRRKQVLAQRQKELGALEQDDRAARSRVTAIRSQIDSIENATPLHKPMEPYTQNLSSEMREDVLNRHRTHLRNYEQAVIERDQSRALLPSLRQDAEQAEREVNRASAAVARQKAETASQDSGLLRDVDEARDRDFAFEISRCLAAAGAAFSQQKAFEGFWTLLGTDVLMGKFEGLFYRPEAARAAGERFQQFGQVLENPSEELLGNIVRGCFKPARKLTEALGENRRLKTGLFASLSELPLSDLVEDAQRARKLLEVEPLELPEYKKLERNLDLLRVGHTLGEIHLSVVSQIDNLKEEIALETIERKDELQRADSEAQQALTKMRAVAAVHSDVLERNKMLWQLVARGASSARLPAAWRSLCATLTEQSAQRLNISVHQLNANVSSSNFAVGDVQSALRTHPLTIYEETRKALGDKLAVWEELEAKAQRALNEVAEQPKRVSEKYRSHLHNSAILSVLPGLGLLSTLWALKLTNAVASLLTEAETPYGSLGRCARSALIWGACANALVASLSVAATCHVFGDRMLDQSSEGWMPAVSAIYVLGSAIWLRNVVVLRAATRRATGADLLTVDHPANGL
ncbi:hypothetical protein ELI44_36970 [Rhizobium ruizarguesonis]|uniref:restriction endonuclease n=1 Tax=Rhizobium ruizarguesonis TaxID=2081791 RepID=UPI00102FE6B0|nr:restriction endonuclease [Rhizobium ruizarguesonis]TAU38908.1 hypothetical protein ELI42_32870 [Rhizobium ruizarguesonis]TAU45905.1 hypothetical protein ELI44_36970 [Rhizobium ruizarguesonis]